MNKDEAGGNWKQFKGKVKEQWGKLTDDDMTRSLKVNVINWSVKSRNVMVIRKIRQKKRSSIGKPAMSIAGN